MRLPRHSAWLTLVLALPGFLVVPLYQRKSIFTSKRQAKQKLVTKRCARRNGVSRGRRLRFESLRNFESSNSARSQNF